ncbi:50S ribosomal protein L21 [Candidatus Arsenophonus lipoptenae]|uniref:Large ribosomal subunit protein bL21 n=1 Tax=Candidatus Arsenophonus lipoptenae TaxID=634113 RepID=A0A0X9VEY9_9GAMM|nr:50S ribosomal protein L21 [Candidatus Arsenophonus lipoptenae]AMA65169.1 50S ribosomal protein L21 [Candidatus Arsenophonus lipoptenae]
MYAIFKNGGKQYKIREGEIIRLEKLNAKTGVIVEFDQILMIVDGNNIKIGTPTIKDAKITAEVVAHGREKKIKIIKFKRRKHSRKQKGHRQWFSDVKIINIF